MDRKTYGIGVIGYGGMGKFHHNKADEFDRLQTIAAFDLSEAALEEAASRGLRTYTTLDDILKNKDINIVVIATPNEVHCEYAIKAMKSGKHVVCEKPAAMNSEEIIKMIEVSKEMGVIFSVHQNRRWDEDYVTMKSAVDQGLLGDVYSIESRVMGSRGIPGDWRAEKQHGGGMMLDWGVHMIDQMLCMYKCPVKQVYARMHHVKYNEVDDGFNLTLTFEKGITALVEVYTCAYITLPRWFVCGDNGTLVINDWSLDGKIIRPHTEEDLDSVVPIKAGAGLTKTMAPRASSVMEELPLPKVNVNWGDYYVNYIDVVEGRAELIVKPEETLRCMQVMEAAFRSEMENRSIDVNI